MQEPVESTPRTAVSRPMRRRPRFLLLVAVVACIFVGRSLGLLGSGEAATADPESGTAPPAAPGGGATVRQGPVAPAQGETHATEPPGPAAAAPRTGGMDADRFASLLSLVEARCEQREFGGALTALQHARSLPLDEGQRTAVQRATQNVRDAADAACRDVVAGLARGEVMAARDLIVAMLADGADLMGPSLSAALASPAGDLARTPAASDLPWPIPVAMARDRAVRARLPEGIVSGRIVDSRSDRVTVRIQGPQGVTFPTLPAAACEPIDPTPAEAVEMGFTALQAGDPLLARLWLHCAGLRGDPPAERAARLADVLR